MDAKNEGRTAYFNGRSETANPYPPEDDRHLSWNDGFIEACNGRQHRRRRL